MALTETEKSIRKIVKETIKYMTELEIYKPQFQPVIRRYSELRSIYDIQLNEFYESGNKVIEEYTNKAGATNNRKTPLALSLEKLRADILSLENVLGLNPITFHRLTKTSGNQVPPIKEPSKLEKMMNRD